MNNELIPIRNKNNQQLVSARDLHKALGSKRQFTHWWGQNSREFAQNIDYTFSPTRLIVGNGAERKAKDYLMTIEMAKKIAMKAETEKGNQVRDYFIQVEKRYKAYKANQESLKQPDSYMIEDPIKRAKRWIQEREAFNEQKRIADKQAKQIKDEAPDVLFSRTMLETHHAEKIGDLALDLTKMGFNIGRNQFFNLLRLEGYISKHSTTPIGDKVKRGYLVVQHRVKFGRAYSTTLVTPKGQKHIINKCLRGKWDGAYQKVMTNTFSF